MSSDAVGLERVSKVVGYKIVKANFNESTPNLPQRIAVLAEANNANQASLDTTPEQITSAQEAGELYGFGSPMHMIFRILRPNSGGGIGGIPTYAYPQAEAAGAAAKVIDVTPTGTATGNGTHYVKVAGRTNVDGEFYAVNIVSGDTQADITAKLADAVNKVIGSPMDADDYTYEVRLTSKWKGLTANALSITVDTTEAPDIGITWSVEEIEDGSGTPSVQSQLNAFGEDWNTIVINSYGIHNATLDLLEAFNGIADPTNPTGRYTGIIMKPFIAFTGTTDDDPSDETESRKTEMTIALCPAPASSGLPMEAAANMALLAGRVWQDNPHLDVSSLAYPDMPVPTDLDIGSMADYENRDAFVKKGCSTVNMIAGKYTVMEFVTSYHPDGELPPQFRYTRNLNIDWNVRFRYYLLEQIHLVDKAIANNTDIVSAQNVIKPKGWKQVIKKFADDLASDAVIVDADFMKDSIVVEISDDNPDRLDTEFSYKRSGYARISSTTAKAGFNFGT